MTKALRFAAVLAVFLTAEMVGRGQNIPRAQPIYPGGSPQGQGQGQGGYGNPAAGYGAQPGGYGERMAVVDPDKKLSAGDQVTVEIVEDNEGGLPRVVTATGDLDVFPLGRVHVGGKTTTEASAEIKRKLEADYYYHATVRLSIDAVSRSEVNAGKVYLSGEVRMVGPQLMIAGEPLTLSHAILKAGAFTEWANQKKVKVTRKVGSETQTSEYNVKHIIETGDINADPVLQDGDRIFVPKVWIRG
jgi:protein involved in polysaccharide export with SLBB domain